MVVEVVVVKKEFWARNPVITKVRGRRGRNIVEARVRQALAIAVYVDIEDSRTRMLMGDKREKIRGRERGRGRREGECKAITNEGYTHALVQ